MKSTQKISPKKAKELYSAILKLNTVKECKDFFSDLLTQDEIREFSERWFIVQCLDKNIPYRDISKLSGLSTTTVTRVAKWFQKGTGGYRLVLKRVKEG